MKTWIANALWSALAIFAGRLHDWIFDPNRAARIRFKNRETWWFYYQKSLKTKDARDDMRAHWWQIQFDFCTSPEAAKDRGDLSNPYRP